MPSLPVDKLPKSLGDVRELLRSLDFEKLKEEIDQDLRCRVCIAGPVNSGKSTLFNLLYGSYVSPVTPVPGTTRQLIREDLGPFTIIDTPGFGEIDGSSRVSVALDGVRQANLVILVLDAAAGVRAEDCDLLRRLTATGKPIIVVLNKLDIIKRDEKVVVEDAQVRLGVPVVPISAKEGTNVSALLIPRIVNSHVGLAVVVGRELPAFRRRAVDKVVATAAALCTVVGMEPIPGASIPLLLGTQARLVLRIAAIYGEPMDVHHARELIATMVGGFALRYLGREAAKLVPFAGWAVSGVMAGASTYAIGRVAVEYFESGKTLSGPRMRQVYRKAQANPGSIGEEYGGPTLLDT